MGKTDQNVLQAITLSRQLPVKLLSSVASPLIILCYIILGSTSQKNHCRKMCTYTKMIYIMLNF